MATIADAWPSLVGTVIGAGAAIGATIATQRAIGSRERRERDRHEARVRAMFATHSEAVATLLGWQVEDGSVWDYEQFERAAEPLRRFVADPALLLALEPEAIDAAAKALAALDINLRFARGENLRYTQMAASASPERKVEILDQERKMRPAMFKRSYEAFNELLVELRGRAAS